MEKILKTIDSLKMPSLSTSVDANIPGTINSAVAAASDAVKTKKKERINHCRAVADAVCNPGVQGLVDYGKILESVTEVLFQLCNDSDSDIRLVAMDCLHRIARTLKETLQPKFHMEVYREIRKNQSPRSLKTALNIFAFICPMIRPQKCRAFLSSLLPCFAQISKRTEELLYENISSPFCEIMQHLGPFAHESEVKILCKEFVGNLESNSAIIRRASASILVFISQYSKNPSVTLPQLLEKVTDLLMPNLMEKNVSVIIGVLLCIRQCIPGIYKLMKNTSIKWKPEDEEAVVDNLIQVYEMCMILCNHDDHNVITTSLESLQQLFSSPPEPVIMKLLSTSGIQNSLDEKIWNMRKHTPLASSTDNLTFTDDAANLLESDLDVPKFRSFISTDSGDLKEGYDAEPSLPSSSRRNSDLFIIEGTLSDVGSLDGLHPSDDEQPDDITEPKLAIHTFPELQIGSLYEKNVPVLYCVRFLSYNFLLSGQKGIIRADNEVRISVKVLALNCIVNLVAICPEIMKLPLSHVLVETGTEDEQQKIEDVVIYKTHQDPLLRGTVYVLLGTLISSSLIGSLRNQNLSKIDYEELINVLQQGLEDSSNVGVKCAISGTAACVHVLLKSSSELRWGERLICSIINAASNGYWLVKAEIAELLSSVDWSVLEGVDDLRDKVLNVFLEFLCDEDPRVRTSCVSALSKFIKSSGGRLPEDSQLFCKNCVATRVDTNLYCTTPCSSCTRPSTSSVLTALKYILMRLFEGIKESENKFSMAGNFLALANLSETFSPSTFRESWGCANSGISNTHILISVSIDNLRSSPSIFDSLVHQSILTLSGNLLIASDFYKAGIEKGKSVEDRNPFRCHNPQISNCGIQLLQHCLAVMKLYQNVVDSITWNSALRRQSTSPVMSPVKKFSQKLEAERKAQDSESEKKMKGLSFSETVCPNHFRKLNDSILQSWKVYKSSLDPVVTSKFMGLLITAVNTLRKLFIYVRPDYPAMTALIEEILNVSSTLFSLCPVPILKLIRQMLKCIFSLYDADLLLNDNKKAMDNKCNVEDFLLFSTTYENVLVESRPKDKPASKIPTDKSSLASFIRQFESAVVTALRLYTTSSNPEVQGEVLKLLIQLIRGHVNYGLVDSSQVFLGFVLKQIPFLQEGHMRDPDLMAQEIFQFLTVLTHEYNTSKKFIDISKIIQLSNGLVAAADNLGPAAVAAVKHIVNDLFILRSGISCSNQEKKEQEAQREEILESVKKLAGHSEALPLIWLLLKGRKLSSEAKWQSESKLLGDEVLSRLADNRLTINETIGFNNLASVLLSLNSACIPIEEQLCKFLNNALATKNEDLRQYCHWCVLVNSYLLLLVNHLHNARERQILNENSSSLILGILEKAIRDLLASYKCVPMNKFAITQVYALLKILAYILKSESCEEFRQDIRQLEYVDTFTRCIRLCLELAVVEPGLRTSFVELLSSIQYPKTSVWDALVQPQRICPSILTKCIFTIISSVNDGDVPTVEEWLIVNHTKTILTHFHHPDVALFIRRLSTYRMEQVLDQITLLVEKDVELLLSRNILKYLQRVSDSFLCETAVLAVKLMKRALPRFIQLEASELCREILSLIQTRKVLLSNKDREFLREYFSNSSLDNRYPRLVTLAHSVLCEETSLLSSTREKPNLILLWCTSEINDTEGMALAKILNHTKYTHISAILSDPEINISLLKYCFQYVQHCNRMGLMTSDEVSALLTSQRRTVLIEKWPVSVAAVELIVETLDAWESYVSQVEKDGVDGLLEIPELRKNLKPMWSALTEMLRLKHGAHGTKGGSEKNWERGNNFIPTGIFTLSFQYMAAQCNSNASLSYDELRVFLKFAATAVCDPSFLNFFDVRDNPPHLLTCVTALGQILRKMVRDLKLSYSFNFTETDSQSGMNDVCVDVLNEFYVLMEFIHQARSGQIYFEAELLEEITNVVSGLGRCELVNGWVLISHLGWKPQAVSKGNIFPPIQQIPLEILRTESDMLLKYIAKLNLLGVASKIQFEENWVIFLSVINLYVDETFELKIVTTGLRALSMMLQQSIRVKWNFANVSEKTKLAALRIDSSLEEVEPEMCRRIDTNHLALSSQREFDNEHGIDVNSCIRFLTDLYSQWLQNPQGKMPLHLLSEVIQSIVVMAEYFEDSTQYAWMYETLGEIQKSLDKEDDLLWPHLTYGVYCSAAQMSLEPEAITTLSSGLETCLGHSSANIAGVGLKCALVFLRSHPDNLPVVNIVIPHLLKCSQLDEMTNGTESHCLQIWNVLLFIWIHGPSEGLTVADFEQDTLRNILTVLSPLNKVYVSVRILVLKGLRLKIQMGNLKPDVKKTISKVTLETLRTPNVCIFFEAIKVYLTMYYADFGDHIDHSDLDPEVLMPMAERADLLFQQLRSKTKCHNQIISKVLPLVISEFLPPSEILNRVIAEFLAPTQTYPEIVAPSVAQVFEKARRRPKEAAVVREWILASLPNFLANANISRAMWSLTLFFIGVSTSPEVQSLLPFAQLRRRASQTKDLFIFASVDFYLTLDDRKKQSFKKLLGESPPSGDPKNKPYEFLLKILEKADIDREHWWTGEHVGFMRDI